MDVSEPEEAYSALRRCLRLSVSKISDLNDFSANLKYFPTETLNGRVPVREVTVFGRFGARESEFCPPENLPAYRLQDINFERRFGT